MPNFSRPKRPIPTTSHVEPESPQPALFEQAEAKAEITAPASVVSTSSPAPPAAKDQPPKPGLASRLAQRVRQWILKRKAHPFQSKTVQTELGLDKVKVLRNDLNEDGLEVVTVENKAAQKTEKPPVTEKLEPEKATVNP